MSSKREKFSTIFKRQPITGLLAVALTVAFGNALPQAMGQWGGADTTINASTTLNGTAQSQTAGSLTVNNSLTISGGATVTTSKYTLIQNGGNIGVSGGSILTVGSSTDAGAVPTGSGTLNIANGGLLKMIAAGGTTDSAKLYLNGNTSFQGASATGESVNLGANAVVNGSGATGKTLGTGTGSSTMTDTVISMGDGSAIISGSGGMSINGSSITQSGYSGGQYLATSGAMGVGSSTIKFGVGSTIEAGTTMQINGATTSVTQGDDSLLVSNQGLTINGGAKINQGDRGQIRSRNNSVTISGTGTEVHQGDNSSIYGATGVTISQGAEVYQGDDSTVATAAGQTITINGASLTQGDNSSLDGTLSISNATITQGSNSILRTDGDLIIDKSSIFQDANGMIAAGTGKNVVIQGDDTRHSYVDLGRIGKLYTNDSLTIDNSILAMEAGSQILSSDATRTDPLQILVRNKGAVNTFGLVKFDNKIITLESGGGLVGNGTIHLTDGTELNGIGNIYTTDGLFVTGGAFLNPGANAGDIATLDITGSLTFDRSGAFVVDTDAAGNSDRLNVKNLSATERSNVALGDATLDVALLRANYNGTGIEYTLIQSEGDISGEFGAVDFYDKLTGQSVKFLDAVQEVNAVGTGSEYVLRIERNHYFQGQGWTFNQSQAGRMLDDTRTDGLWWDALTRLSNLDPATLACALQSMSGEVKASSMTMYMATPWRSALDQIGWTTDNKIFFGPQNRYCPNFHPRNNFWISPYHNDTDYRGDDNALGYNVSSTGFLSGINRKIDPTTSLGIVFGYGRPELTQHGNDVKADDFLLGLQGGMRLTTKIEMKAFVGVGFQSYDSRRYVFDGADTYRAESDYDGNTLFASIELARPFYLGNCTTIKPLVAFDSENVWQDSAVENGAGIYSLEYAKRRNDRTYVRTGITGELGAKNLTVSGKVFYSHQMGGSPYSDSEARFAGSGAEFVRFHGIDLERDFLTLGIGGNIYLNSNRTSMISGNYDAVMSAKSTAQTVFLTFTQLF